MALIDLILNYKILLNLRALTLIRKYKLSLDIVIYINDFLKDEEAVRNNDIIIVNNQLLLLQYDTTIYKIIKGRLVIVVQYRLNDK